MTVKNHIQAVIFDVGGVLDELHGRVRLAIISNASGILEMALERRFQIAHYFEVIINSARVGYAKPDPRIFKIAAGANCLYQ